MMDELSFVVTTLERINSKLDKHDEKFDMIVLSMQQLVKVDTENKEIKESIVRVFKRLEIVENNQNTDGCQAHKNFVKLIEKDDFDKRITTLEQKPIKAIDKFYMAVLGALGAGFGGWLLLKFGVGK